MKFLRPRVVGDGNLPIARRRRMLKELASEEALDVLDRRGAEQLWTWLEQRNRAL